jgi:uncharacterized protein (TIGR02246 family)
MPKINLFQTCIAITAVVLLFITGCQPSESAALLEEDRAAIEASDKAWEEHALANDWAALAALYAEDAMYMAPGESPVEGRDNIQKWFESQPPTIACEIRTVEIDGQGDFAFTRGTYTTTFSPEGMDPITDTGKYLAVCRKQADGTWLISRDIYNSD